jgi:hypothetical protein
MKPILIEAQYLPPIAYFSAMQSCDEIVLERHEHYVKQTYRNRCSVNTTQGRADLIIPLTSKHGKTVISEVKIDYTQKWLNNHWRTIQSAYANAPFFEYYADTLHQVLFKKEVFLFDLNAALLSMCLKWLKWPHTVRESLSYEKSPEGVIDRRSQINPKKIDVLGEFFTPIPYTQVFGSTFEVNLSIIDLIFCVGPSAAGIVRDSAKEN